VLIDESGDYEVTYNGAFVDAGQYEIVLTPAPNSNYQGEKKLQYSILKYGLNENETLFLKFQNDKATFDTNITKQEFESKLNNKKSI
jgi:hypothetical protein